MTKFKLILTLAFRDLSKQKVRTFVGIFGVMISIGLLSIVLFISDSISYTFIDYVSQDAGNQDMNITVRHYNGEPINRSDYFSYNSLISQVQDSTNKIDAFIPRMSVSGQMNISGKGDIPTRYEKYYSSLFILGINFSLEKQHDFGQLIDAKSGNILDLEGLPLNQCLIHQRYNNYFDYSEGDVLEMNMSLSLGKEKLIKPINLTINRIFDYELKFPEDFQWRNFIVVDIKTLYNQFGRNFFKGKCNELILAFEDNQIYDIRNIEASEEEVKDLAGEIQKAIGIREYNIKLPKLRLIVESNVINMV
ncbi:MAG: hypothetical protein EU548_04430, partial [Promethearchaeota archaeon]